MTGITHLGTIMDAYDAGPYYGVPLDGGCNTVPKFVQDRKDTYQNQYGSATFPSDQIAVDRVRRPAARVQRVGEFG